MKLIWLKFKSGFCLTLGGFLLECVYVCVRVCVSIFFLIAHLMSINLYCMYPANHLKQYKELFSLILQKPHKKLIFGKTRLCLSVFKAIKILLTWIYMRKEGGISNSCSYSFCIGIIAKGVVDFVSDVIYDFNSSFLAHKKLHFFPQHLLLELKLFSNKVWELSWRLIYFPNSVNKTESLTWRHTFTATLWQGLQESTWFPCAMDPSS